MLPSFSGQGLPAFCRDGKGNIYIGNGNTLHFYTSEGDRSGTPTVVTGNIKQLVGDSKTGKVYLLDDNKNLYDVQAESPLSNWPSVSLSSAGFSTGDARIYLIAAHDGQLFVFGRQTPVDNGLYVYDIEYESNPTPPPSQRIKLTSVTNKEIAEPPSGITDMFVTDDAVYLLRKEYAVPPVSSGNVYSKGALIKYDYDKDEKKIDDKEEFGESNEDAQNGIVPTPDTSFYGPLKFIGFDDDVLYIADDGVKFEYLNEKLRITVNKNRIASFNTASNSLSFADTNETWEKEEKVWKAPQKTLLWKARTEENNTTVFDYYAVDEANSPLGVRPDIKSESKNDYYTDVFCFDQDGALYVLKKDSSDYKVVRYEPAADGGYDFSHPAEAVLPALSSRWISIAVDASGTIPYSGDTYNALYYYCIDALNGKSINRISWKTTDDFSAAVANGYNGISVTPPVSDVTALTANKDGFFAAIKEESGNIYTLKVYKLAHTYSGPGLPAAFLTVGTGILSDTKQGFTYKYDEDINALQIADGVLYGISTKRENNSAPAFFMSGKLLKLGNTDGSFTGTLTIDTALLYGTKDVNASANGDFAPYRFIAVKPKKLVIASDGAYGQQGTTMPQNKNRVLIFTLDGSDNAGTPASLDLGSAVQFSHELEYDTGSGFVWR